MTCYRLLEGFLFKEQTLFTLVIGLDARCIHQNSGLSCLVCLPLRPGNPRMTRRTLDSQSYKDSELVKVKTVVGHVRPSLQV